MNALGGADCIVGTFPVAGVHDICSAVSAELVSQSISTMEIENDLFPVRMSCVGQDDSVQVHLRCHVIGYTSLSHVP